MPRCEDRVMSIFKAAFSKLELLYFLLSGGIPILSIVKNSGAEGIYNNVSMADSKLYDDVVNGSIQPFEYNV